MAGLVRTGTRLLAMGAPKPLRRLVADDIRVARIHLGDAEYAVISLPAHDDRAPVLTDAEREIARFVAAGWSKSRIARRRRSSVNTVANQVASIYAKLDVRSRAELVARWAGRL